MKRNLISSLLICVAVIPALLFQSCATANLNQNTKNNNIIMRLYIALSSNINQEEIEDVANILRKHFDGAALQEASGYYKEEREKPKDQFLKGVNKLVLKLSRELGQESMLVEHSSYG